MAWNFQATKITRGEATAYLPTRGEVYVEDHKSRYVIRRAGNSKDGLHRWANFRKWVKCGSWSTASEVKTRAVCAYGHASTPWITASTFALPEYAGASWVDAQKKWRNDVKKG